MLVINNALDDAGERTAGFGTGVPIGGIVIWYGSGSAVPSGYAILNGSAGQIDMRGRFPIGASSSGQLKTTGGATSHYHSANVSDGGGHNHKISYSSGGDTTYNRVSDVSPAVSVSEHGHDHSGTVQTGWSGGHVHTPTGVSASQIDVYPPYSKLYYIRRIS
jgi:hypothetical protein